MDETLPQSPGRDLLVAQLRVISRVSLVVMIPLVFFFTTEGTWDLLKQRDDGGYSGGFFMAQAEAINRGRLSVPTRTIRGECFFRGIRCYGYMGVTPSLLRWPDLLLLQWLGSALTPLYLGVAVLLGYWAALQLLVRSLVETSGPDPPRGLALGYAVVGAIALGPGGTLLFLTRPAVFEEASAWAMAFFLLALDRVWAWRRSRRLGPLSLALVFAVASVNARPTPVIACGVLGLLVAVLALVGNSPGPLEGHRPQVGPRPVSGLLNSKALAVVAAACLSLLPGLTAGGVYWGKFGTPIPDMRLNEQIPEAPHWEDVLRLNGDRTVGLVFTPTELVAYFRPDTLTMQREWPFFDFRFPKEPILWVPPLHPGGAYVERVASVTSTMPLPWAVTMVVVVWLSIGVWRLSAKPATQSTRPLLPRLTRDQWILSAGSLASAAAIAILPVTTVGITNRYLGDFFAISVVGIALGHVAILPVLHGRRFLTATAGLVALLLSGWSVLVTLSLTTQLVFW